MLQFRLEQAGYAVLAAQTGSEAILLAAEKSPDVLLLDVGLPDVSGFEVCRRVLAAAQTPPAVIFLTARDTTADRVTGLGAGAVDYVAKPFESAELVARVNAALRTKKLLDGLSQQATTDALTGLLNRGELDRRLREQEALALRGRPFGCLILDIDHFKNLNDRHGHAAGDEVLREVARRLRASVRAADLVFRYGGEEFLLLLPETDVDGAEALARSILDRIGALPVVLPDAPTVSVTVSVGVAGWPATRTPLDGVLAAADRALYDAKRAGRARVRIAA